MVHRVDFDTLLKEIKKCDLLCRNCHFEEHYPHLSIDVSSEGCVEFHDKSVQANRICEVCGGYSKGQRYCSRRCYGMSKRRVERPSKEELQMMLKTETYVALGAQYGVSDNTIRRWAKK